MAKAYGSLTITDLLDIATYIYYSPNEDGSGATLAPEADSKYIGVYSGPSFNNILSWDFNLDNREVFYNYIVKMHNDIPSLQDLEKGFTITFRSPLYEDEVIFTQEDVIVEIAEDNSYAVIGNDNIPIIVIAYTTNPDGANITPGTYFIDLNWVVSQEDPGAPEKLFSEIKFAINGYKGFAQPLLPPPETQWSSYVGPKGDKGDEGKGVSQISYEYGNSDSSTDYSTVTKWDDTPNPIKGKYLWTKMTISYTEGNPQVTYSVSYTSQDGNDAVLHLLESNYEEILKTVDKIEENYITSVIPSSLDVVLKKQIGEIITTITDLSNYSFNLDFISAEQKMTNILATGIGELTTQINGEVKKFFQKNPDSLELNFSALLDKTFTEDEADNNKDLYDIIQFFKTEEGYFLLKIFLNSDLSTPVGQLPLHFRYAQSDETAKFFLHKSYIDMLVGNTAVTITDQGLTIKNGNFNIIRDDGETEEQFVSFRHDIFYTETTDTIPLSNKIYYIKNEDSYEEVTLLKEFQADTVYYEKHNGRLSISGNSTFSGELKAATGVFSGRLEANEGYFQGKLQGNSGIIGGFEIKNGELNSVGKDNEENSFIKLDGNNGQIVAKNITLGIGAKIEDYIEFGNNSYIYTPTTDNGQKFIFINNGAINLKADGTGNIGDITFNGVDSIIRGGDPSTSNFFSITPEKAIFKNVDITGTIHTSVFEIGKVQSVGGAMIFRPSAKIKDMEEINDTDNISEYNNIVLENNIASFHVGDYVVFGYEDNFDNEPNRIQSINNGIITLLKNLKSPPISMTQLGNVENNDTLIIGVNSGDKFQGILKPRSISFIDFKGTSYNDTTKKITYVTENKVVVGDLSTIGKDNVSGYGLYGENVFLTGSLTTQNNNTYAGVNTLSEVKSTEFTDSEENIIFWAGSEGIDSGQIQKAPFQVTDRGSLYASRGIFEGTIITNAQIEAASLKTAAIYGSGKTVNNINYPALRVFSTKSYLNAPAERKISDGGIEFWQEEIDNDNKATARTLRIDENGLYYWNNTNWESFITIQENSDSSSKEVIFNGALQKFGNQIEIGRLSLGSIIDANSTVERNFISSFVATSESKTTLITLEFPTNSSQGLSIKGVVDIAKFAKDKIQLQTDNVEIKKEFVMAEGNMRYTPVGTSGYDLFISEAGEEK